MSGWLAPGPVGSDCAHQAGQGFRAVPAVACRPRPPHSGQSRPARPARGTGARPSPFGRRSIPAHGRRGLTPGEPHLHAALRAATLARICRDPGVPGGASYRRQCTHIDLARRAPIRDRRCRCTSFQRAPRKRRLSLTTDSRWSACRLCKCLGAHSEGSWTGP